MSAVQGRGIGAPVYQVGMNFELTSTMWGNSSLHICTLGYQSHTFAVLEVVCPLHQEVVLSWGRDMRGPQATSHLGSQ